LVLSKPAGLSTTAPAGDCLVERARALDPVAPRLHPSSRLDAEVTGIVTFARTREATKALLEARRRGRYGRLYLALAAGSPVPPSGDWCVAIGVDPADPRRRVAVTARSSARERKSLAARTSYATVEVTEVLALLALRPATGRTHQLRVHAAHAGVPLLGDVHYGGARRITLADGRVLAARRVMLHCAAVRVPNLDSRREHLFVVPPPEDFAELFRRGGGTPERLATLLSEPF
jgi:23S rRNA-/tRNA-specific pseudouridylate synthase